VSGFPALAELLPHAGPMRLLERVLAHAPDGTRCAVRTEDAPLFQDADGGVPAWLAIEWMAQCVAAHGGLLGRSRGEPPRVGFLVGARALELRVARFEPGDALVVEARPRRSTAGLFDFACRVERAADGAVLAEGRVQCFVQESAAALKRLGWKDSHTARAGGAGAAGEGGGEGA